MKRPRSVTVIGWLLLLQGLLLILLAGATLAFFSAQSLDLLPPDLAAELPAIELHNVLIAAADLGLGIFGLVSGIGLLRLRPWAWLMAMIIQGVYLAIGLVSYARGAPSYLELLTAVIIVFCLNQRDIQRAFQVAQHRHDPASLRTVEADRVATAEVQSEVAARR